MCPPHTHTHTHMLHFHLVPHIIITRISNELCKRRLVKTGILIKNRESGGFFIQSEDVSESPGERERRSNKDPSARRSCWTEESVKPERAAAANM